MESHEYIPSYIGPSYADLPMEIIIHIMSFLHTSDIYPASISCRRWFEASQHPHFASQIAVNFSRVHLTNGTAPICDFLNSYRNYTKISLSEVDFGQTTEFWERFGDVIQEITFKNCDIREKTLNTILRNLSNLNSLEIDNCRELFMSGRLFEKEIDKQAICIACQHMSSLRLTNNRYLSDALFNRFVTVMPKLSKLDLSGCHISFHKGLYKKFYPDNQKDASESVLTFHYISHFIEYQASLLNSLNFSCTLIDGAALSTLASIERLNLETLQLRSCDQLTNSGIITFIQTQRELQQLDLSFSVRLTDPGLMEICSSLPQLKVLKLRRCRAITDLSVKEILNLKNLITLDISECELVTSRGIIDGIAKVQNSTLKELHVSALNICEMAVTQIAHTFTNLRVLDLSFCKNGVTNLAVQLIVKYIPWLRVLNLEYCDMISDAAITGMDMNDKVQNYENSKNLIVNNSPTKTNINQPQPLQNEPHPIDVLRQARADNVQQARQPIRISLSSRAEQDIIMDAKRKKVMLEMYEHNSKMPDCSSGYSIDSLKGLRILNLTACNKITDVSLKYSFHLAELKELSLSKCQQVSTFGIECLIKNCPSLEIINLSECHNINDKTIEIITQKLKRLTHLYLERCIQLTDHSLDYMAVNCTSLKYLDVRGCRSMCSEPILRLVNLTSLKHIAMSKPGPYLMDIVTLKRPKPPPMPLAF